MPFGLEQFGVELREHLPSLTESSGSTKTSFTFPETWLPTLTVESGSTLPVAVTVMLMSPRLTASVAQACAPPADWKRSAPRSAMPTPRTMRSAKQTPSPMRIFFSCPIPKSIRTHQRMSLMTAAIGLYGHLTADLSRRGCCTPCNPAARADYSKLIEAKVTADLVGCSRNWS
ncbi:MAG: hypothetical protein M5U26_17630 [Planctomycetota bacterium]|nr:hypothetical protein [Planctomycetota bacterium]